MKQHEAKCSLTGYFPVTQLSRNSTSKQLFTFQPQFVAFKNCLIVIRDFVMAFSRKTSPETNTDDKDCDRCLCLMQ